MFIFSTNSGAAVFILFSEPLSHGGGFSDDDNDDYTVLAPCTSPPFFDQASKKQKTENSFPSHYVFAENILNRR
jgi:hypothetical protein